MRYESVIRKRQNSHWPARILCVGIRSGQWAMVALQLCEGSYHRTDTWSGTDAEAFWRAVALDSVRRKALTILSSDTQRYWEALGFYLRLEADDLYIYPPGLDADNWVAFAHEAVREERGLERPCLSAGELRTWLSRHTGMLIISDPPTIWRGWQRGSACTITWLDIANYGLTLGSRGIDVGDIAADVAAVVTRLHTYSEEHLHGAYGLTAGRLSICGWTLGYRQPGSCVHGHPEALRFERAGYLAGRAECYRLGPDLPAIWYADATAAYAFHARQCAVPVRLRRWLGATDCSARVQRSATAHCLGDVTVRTSVARFPCRVTVSPGGRAARAVVGTAAETDYQRQQLVFPVGEFRTVLPGPELAVAVRLGCIVQWHGLAEYDCEPALHGIAGAILQWRAKAIDVGDPDMLAVAKALYRHLVGHLGKRNCTWEPVDSPDCDTYYGEWVGGDRQGVPVRYRAIAGQMEREGDSGYAADTLPAAAAWITSYQRLQLWDHMEIAGREHVYYCDTDGIMVDDRGRARLHAAGVVRPSTVGYLDMRWGPCRVHLRGLKHYEYNGHVVCAGLAAGSHGVPDTSRAVERVETGAEAVRKRRRPSARRVVIDTMRTATYRHGVVMSDGRVEPYNLGGST